MDSKEPSRHRQLVDSSNASVDHEYPQPSLSIRRSSRSGNSKPASDASSSDKETVYRKRPRGSRSGKADQVSSQEPSASTSLLDEYGAHLLSPSSSDRAEDRLNALIYPEQKYSLSRKPIKSFYASQNEFIGSLKKLVLLNETKESDEKPSTAAFLAIQISLALTFVLLGLKLFTAIYSGSIAVVASAVDSALDVLSQGTLLFTSRLMKKYDPYGYPAGKNRMEPTAVLTFSIIMGMAALFLLYESVTDLTAGLSEGGKHVKMDAVTVSILAFVVGVQLVMWIYCRRIAALNIPGASAADALAQDHINDVFINLIGGIPAIIAGYIQSAWIADPVGGICLSCYIAMRWTHTGIQQIPAMTGKTADPSFLNQLTYLAGTHDPRILKVDTVLAYHVGHKYQCEVHIVLAKEMSLEEAHDIGESLEQKIERLDMVEMAFVHLDYEFEHEPEHAARSKAAGKETKKSAPETESVGAQQPPPSSPSDARINVPAADHSIGDERDMGTSIRQLLDSVPTASMPATVSLASNPTHAPITGARSIPSSRASATGH